jgi:hypothetical protein
MQWMVDEMMKESSIDKTVTRKEYEQWARGFVFEGLRNLRYGQSFCNQFGITDNILFYAGTVAEADQYIRKVYVR